jgi:hypothetical protein
MKHRKFGKLLKCHYLQSNDTAVWSVSFTVLKQHPIFMLSPGFTSANDIIHKLFMNISKILTLWEYCLSFFFFKIPSAFSWTTWAVLLFYRTGCLILDNFLHSHRSGHSAFSVCFPPTQTVEQISSLSPLTNIVFNNINRDFHPFLSFSFVRLCIPFILTSSRHRSSPFISLSLKGLFQAIFSSDVLAVPSAELPWEHSGEEISP